MYQDQPPSYSEAINSPIAPTAPPVGMIGQHTAAIPSSSFVPEYPIQAQPHGHVVITKPIQPIQPNIGYGSMAQATVAVPTEIIIINGCPACRIGVLEEDYTCLGICCAIFLFPIGILCCLALKDKRCTNCGNHF